MEIKFYFHCILNMTDYMFYFNNFYLENVNKAVFND